MGSCFGYKCESRGDHIKVVVLERRVERVQGDSHWILTAEAVVQLCLSCAEKAREGTLRLYTSRPPLLRLEVEALRRYLTEGFKIDQLPDGSWSRNEENCAVCADLIRPGETYLATLLSIDDFRQRSIHQTHKVCAGRVCLRCAESLWEEMFPVPSIKKLLPFGIAVQI